MTNIIDYVVKPYVNFINLLETKGYEFYQKVGTKDDWKNFVEENYYKDSKQIFSLGGDFEDELDFIDDKQDVIFLRQSLLVSKKKENEILIPSSYGCVAGDLEMETCEITDKPKISFCGSKNSHPCRPPLFDILENSEELICDFNYITVPCNGAVDPEIKQKSFNFNENMKSSEFVFCPRGNGNFSIRFYEALLSGRIPILLESDNELPFSKYIKWKELCVISDSSANLVEDIINFHKNNDLIKIQEKCRETFQEYFIDDFDVLLLNEILYYEAKVDNNIISIPKVFKDMSNIFNIKDRCYGNFHQPYIYNLNLTRKFWFSRGSGQEGMFAYNTEVLKNKDNIHHYIRNSENFFVNGCGIYFDSMESCLNYSKKYIEAIKKVNIFGAIEKNNQKYQESLTAYLDSHNIDITLDIGLMFEYYYYGAPYYEIFNKIFSNKKILVISSHKNSIEHQIPYLKFINPILETCEFQVIRPPQTSCGNHNNTDWSIHLEKFLKELDDVNDFDLALISAGGYSILISEYIYEKKNKSVIYPGGSLQLWFGIMGNRWKSWWKYHRKGSEEYWIEPLESDKPSNSSLVDGNGAYW